MAKAHECVSAGTIEVKKHGGPGHEIRPASTHFMNFAHDGEMGLDQSRAPTGGRVPTAQLTSVAPSTPRDKRSIKVVKATPCLQWEAHVGCRLAKSMIVSRGISGQAVSALSR
jgi:hypothetical protein